MDKEDTKKAIAVMQAYVDGETIQFFGIDYEAWQDITGDYGPSWDWSLYKYRIKPKPLERWVNVHANARDDCCYESYVKAIEAAGYTCIRRAVHMREATKEDEN